MLILNSYINRTPVVTDWTINMHCFCIKLYWIPFVFSLTYQRTRKNTESCVFVMASISKQQYHHQIAITHIPNRRLQTFRLDYELASHTYLLLFNVVSEINFIYSESFCQIYAERKSQKKYFYFYFDIVSQTSYRVCPNFVDEWRDLYFKIDSER